MTSHTGFGGGNTGEGGVFNGGMAIATINSIRRYVAFVAKRNRLGDRVSGVGIIV
jgi:hypothetical protein